MAKAALEKALSLATVRASFRFDGCYVAGWFKRQPSSSGRQCHYFSPDRHSGRVVKNSKLAVAIER